MKSWMMCSVLMLLSLAAHAENSPQPVDPNIQKIESLLKLPDSLIDLGRAKLIIDHMVEPSSDIKATEAKLNAIVSSVKTQLPANASKWDVVNALRKQLYESGSWNDNKPFQYDFNDPKGTDIRNKLLSTYLETRKGNCISMPFLFIVLGEDLGLKVSASLAPAHVFAKFTDESGKVYNLETTDKAGITSDASYQRQMPMTEQALSNGIYMKPLSRKETIAVMASELMDHYSAKGKHKEVIALADMLLKYYPNYVVAIIHKGNAYGRLIEQQFASKYRSPYDMPPEVQQQFVELRKNSDFWLDRALELGFRPESQMTNEQYMNTVQQAKARQQ